MQISEKAQYRFWSHLLNLHAAFYVKDLLK